MTNPTPVNQTDGHWVAWLTDGVARLFQYYQLKATWEGKPITIIEASASDGGLPVLIDQHVRIMKAMGCEGLTQSIKVVPDNNALYGKKVMQVEAVEGRLPVPMIMLSITHNLREHIRLTEQDSIDLSVIDNTNPSILESIRILKDTAAQQTQGGKPT